MRILFLHDNFPGQFGGLGQYLITLGWRVAFGTQRKGVQLPGFDVFNYAPHRDVTKGVHHYAAGFEKAIINGQAVIRSCIELKKQGYSPDIVMAHSGWGPGIFIKDIWPRAKYVGYFEWYYQANSPDVVYLSSARRDLDSDMRARARNAAILADLVACDLGFCPTQFQKAQFPDIFDQKLKVIHDGVDINYYQARHEDEFIKRISDIKPTDEVITYVARGMEPYRGFPEFMAALEILLRERPRAHAIIVGEDRVAYGARLADGDTYKSRALQELNIDWSRVHFTGLLPRDDYRAVLRRSSVHCYLTIPFVLSWSMMEAMSTGCALVASDVPPVREIAKQSPSALKLVDNNPSMIAEAIAALLDTPERRQNMGMAARALISDAYNAQSIYEQKEKLLRALISA